MLSNLYKDIRLFRFDDKNRRNLHFICG
ncbi:hypothetical protein [Nostoc sp. 'Peltigera malacea cyanobiont' DB3992]